MYGSDYREWTCKDWEAWSSYGNQTCAEADQTTIITQDGEVRKILDITKDQIATLLQSCPESCQVRVPIATAAVAAATAATPLLQPAASR